MHESKLDLSFFILDHVCVHQTSFIYPVLKMHSALKLTLALIVLIDWEMVRTSPKSLNRWSRSKIVFLARVVPNQHWGRQFLFGYDLCGPRWWKVRNRDVRAWAKRRMRWPLGTKNLKDPIQRSQQEQGWGRSRPKGKKWNHLDFRKALIIIWGITMLWLCVADIFNLGLRYH